MVNEELLSEIQTRFERGQTKSEITKALLESGWAEKEVEDIMGYLQRLALKQIPVVSSVVTFWEDLDKKFTQLSTRSVLLLLGGILLILIIFSVIFHFYLDPLNKTPQNSEKASVTVPTIVEIAPTDIAIPTSSANQEKYMLNGVIFMDANKNGKQDTNEQRVSSIPVTVVDKAGTNVCKQTADATGMFTCPSLGAGQYLVNVAIPSSLQVLGLNPRAIELPDPENPTGKTIEVVFRTITNAQPTTSGASVQSIPAQSGTNP
jgi:hypothetical protein